MISIKGLHHSAMRCRDSEETRAFYEDFLGLPLADAMQLGETKTGRVSNFLHTFYEMADGSYIAFFEVPDAPFEFVAQSDFDLHLALEVDQDVLPEMKQKALSLGMEVRGVSDHHIVQSIYFRDPNGYVVELAAKTDVHDEHMDPSKNNARRKLDEWTASKNQTIEA